MIKAWILTAYFLSTGFYTEAFVSDRQCQDALIEAHYVRGDDLWSGVCTGLDDQITSYSVGKESFP